MAEQEAWKQLYHYWLSKHVNGRPPTRQEIDPPIDVPQLIANLMLIDVTDGRFCYRLVGSAFWARYGFELTGRQIEGANPAEAEWLNTLKAVCADRAPRLVTAPVDGHGDKLHVGVALPLSGADGGVCQILAATFYAQEHGKDLRIGRLFVREILDDGR
jgi:hypothetical protein